MKTLRSARWLAPLLVAWVAVGSAHAQPAASIGFTLNVDKTQYLVGEPISVQLTVRNVSGAPLIVPAGFAQSPFHLFLTFVGESGTVVTAPPLGGVGAEHGPPRLRDGVQVEEVETLAADFVLPVSFPDANVFYAGLVPDRYAVSAAFQVTTYPATLPGENVAALGTGATLTVRSNGVRLSVNADLDSDGYSAPDAVSPPFAAIPDCNDHDPEVHPGATEIPSNGVDDDCNKDTPDVPTVPGGTVLVRAERHTVGTGNTPSASKAPLTGLPVLVFDKTPGACAAQLGVSWQTYKAIWWKCPPAQGTGLTDAAGVARVPVPPGNYLVIGEYDADGLPLSGDEIYLGVSVGSVAAGATAEKYLQLIVKADGKNVPAKYTTRTGSELRIIEPEYVEWSGQQELYPFIYESVGDWSVTTSVAPPPGFVADQPVLSADVNNELAVLQFTLTDVGSDWVATGVEHRIRHRGRSETVRSEVGVKLTPELARAHGVTPSGKPVGPHPKP